METPVNKRPRSPTYETPTRPFKSTRRIPLREQENVFSSPAAVRTLVPAGSSTKSITVWDREELKALTEFILLMSSEKTWPAHKNMRFWKEAGVFVQRRAKTNHLRSGHACRFKVVGSLKKLFKSPIDAEVSFKSPIDAEVSFESPTRMTSADSTTIAHLTSSGVTSVPAVSSKWSQTLISVQSDAKDELSVLSEAFSKYMANSGIEVCADFLSYCASAMRRVKETNRSNVIYNLAKGLGTLRVDGTDSCFPCRRMPMGLVEFMSSFFASDNRNNVIKCPEDYRLWLQTMYVNFGQKWAKLFHGPMWSFSGDGLTCEEALVNVPSLSERTLRRDIEESGITVDAKIQVHVLDKAVALHPHSWWWIKTDGVDVVQGVGESVRMEWSGDVDLNDGSLQQQYEKYIQRLEFLKELGVDSRNSHCQLVEDMRCIENDVSSDLSSIHELLKETNNEYSKKQAGNHHSDKIMLGLLWDIHDLEELNSVGRKLCVEMSVLREQLEAHVINHDDTNVIRKILSLRDSLSIFVKGLTRHQRSAATHCLVVMISPEERTRKPYALPVQCLPYNGLKDCQVRDITNKVLAEMVKRGMKVAGVVTNGEWNSNRTKGNTRPLSVLQIRSEVRSKYGRMSEKRMSDMLDSQRVNNTFTAKVSNPAVSESVLRVIWEWKNENCSMDDIIARLRLRTTPSGYPIHTWVPGRDETRAEKLRSILAQMEYKMRVMQWVEKGVNFADNLYVPEVHPLTGEVFCEMEDEGHVFKRIGNALRLGGPPGVRLERFSEALKDPSAGLTYPALVGTRKQSIEDVERLFGFALIDFMKKNGYREEEKFIRIIRNWRRGIDERGLSASQRLEFDTDLINYLLDHLMPWHCTPQMRDFSLLEVNRDISCIQGLTREILIALCADVESRRHRYKAMLNTEYPPHPRSMTTDDVECFFSVLRDSVGKNFTVKQVFYGWRKACIEFEKRLDPVLPFYYYSSSDRFYEDDMPSFDKPSSKPLKNKRVPRRELVAAGQLGRRVSLAARGNTSIRATYHNYPVELPPPPGQPCQDHTYTA